MDTNLEQYAKIQAMVQKEARDIANQVYTEQAAQFGIPKTPYHIHNGVDSPILIRPDVSYIGFVPQASYLTMTGALLANATSGTLTGAWAGDTCIQSVSFVSATPPNEIRQVQFSNGSTAISWLPGLTYAATDTFAYVDNGLELILPEKWVIRYDEAGIYTILHNLGIAGNNNFYSFVVSATQSTNAVVVPIVSNFENEVTVSWFDSTDGLTRTDTAFNFIMTTGNTNTPIKVGYVTRNVT